MELKLYDTLTREKRVFAPIDPKRVRMYVCGPTVYDYAHIGNARPVIVFDVLFRLLRQIYGPDHVTYVRNVTDVDDKINARAAERGISIGELTKTTYDNFKADVDALGCLPPTFEPRATDYVSKPAASIDMIRLIERLIASSNAYVAEGHVLFAVSTMPDYGKLSKRSLDEMEAGARVEVAPYKRNPMDFVLWKPSPPDLPGWDSPWGRGRPGWHIECSAMSAALLGETFDIHGGGIDLVFPHHENEVAQSRCAFHTPVMANYWMHNGFLQVEGEKMAKSAGNFVTIHELLNSDQFGGRKWPGLELRLAMLMTHYREPINFSAARLSEAQSLAERFVRAARFSNASSSAPDQKTLDLLMDDLNTYEAIQRLRELSSIVMGTKRSPDAASADELAHAKDTFLATASLFGFKFAKSGEFSEERAKFVNERIAARNAARKAKDFKESDRIRDELAAMGVVLKDSKDGTTWEVAR